MHRAQRFLFVGARRLADFQQLLDQLCLRLGFIFSGTSTEAS
jgi:hypothetical protein